MQSLEATFWLRDAATRERIRLQLAAHTLGHLHTSYAVTRTYYLPGPSAAAGSNRFLLWSDVPPNGKEHVVLEDLQGCATPTGGLDRIEATASRDMMRIIQALGFRPTPFRIQSEHFQTGGTGAGFLRFAIEDVEGLGRFLKIRFFGSKGGDAAIGDWVRRLGLRPQDEEGRPYCDMERTTPWAHA